VVCGQVGQGGVDPGPEPGQLFLARGQDIDRDEGGAQVVDVLVLWQGVVADRGVFLDQTGDDSGDGAGAQPPDNRPRVVCPDQRFRQRQQLRCDRPVSVAEQVGGSIADHAAGAAAIGVEVAGMGAGEAGEVNVDAGARPADSSVVVGAADEHSCGVAACAGCGVAGG
jgi:hypothetical protein